jgi:periplasmic protein CpxP/Spy
MLLRRVSVLSLLLLSLGSIIALGKPNSNVLSPNLVQNFENRPPQERIRHNLMEELNLGQEQQQKLRAIQYRYKNRIEGLQEGIHQSTQEFRSLMITNIDSGQIRNKYQEVQQLQQQLEDLRLESILEMREVLTPDQRSRFAQMMEQRKNNFQNMMRN